MAAAEFIRFAALDAIEGGAAADEDGDRLDPLIERTFRYSYMMATKMRDDMRAVDRGEELEVLIPELRKPVQRNSMRAWDEKADFKGLILMDEDIRTHLSAEEIEEVFDLRSTLQHVETVFERVFSPA